jgi:hypothetical protein
MSIQANHFHAGRRKSKGGKMKQFALFLLILITAACVPVTAETPTLAPTAEHYVVNGTTYPYSESISGSDFIPTLNPAQVRGPYPEPLHPALLWVNKDGAQFFNVNGIKSLKQNERVIYLVGDICQSSNGDVMAPVAYGGEWGWMNIQDLRVDGYAEDYHVCQNTIPGGNGK